MKISDPAGNQTRDTGLEGRDYTNQSTATDYDILYPFFELRTCFQIDHVEN